ncbi:MAG: hypothetical protein HQK54_14245 [Oligoflexales bacterium]|nr:hypothetical protein [Oligoflexales bacterium]
MLINYKVKISEDRSFSYQVDLDRTAPNPDNIAFWTNLEFSRCRQCPLDPKTEFYCPVALDVQDVVNAFIGICSFDEVDCTVETEKRGYFKRCSSQNVLKSLLGLIMMSSSCPILSKFRMVAYFHIPFFTSEELFIQCVSCYFLSQYQNQAQGKVADFKLDGLRPIWNDFKNVTHDFIARVRMASKTDASLNALISLNAFSGMSQRELDDLLNGLKDLKKDLRAADD